MQPAPKRHHLVGPLILSNEAALHSRQHATCDLVLAQEDDGLAAWCLRLGPNMRTHAPDPAYGGGQYLLVAGGTLWHDGAMLPRLSCLYVSADTGPFVLQSGAEGLEVLLLQFPVAEASAAQPGTMSRTRRPAHGGAGTGNAAGPRPSGGHGKPAMAHPEHVALVQQGATAIAAWREAHPGERLHLAEADLAGANLRGANLHGARLSGAILDGADLVGADLQHADLRAASLVEADLTGARLQYASLVRAHLARARLPWARLLTCPPAWGVPARGASPGGQSPTGVPGGHGSERRGFAWSVSGTGGPAMGQSARDYPERRTSAGGEPARERHGVDHLWPHASARRDGGLPPADTRPPAPSMWGRAPARGASRWISCAAAAGQTRRSPVW